ncbi:UNVERIFIED_CONTAM: hypothetical protein GTU68_014461 [Idotea baltica]|nr:hypothetical protein [Idotea baltica]
MLKPEIAARYQPVIGLEIHVQLSTQSKVFATESFEFGGNPNEYVSPISLAHPGALPSLNQACIMHVAKMGLALNCSIASTTYFARKNYFYPDLPKGYQLSQAENPICQNGHIDVRLPDGSYRNIRIERIHLEEDAGKSIHDQDDKDSLIDLNRAGVGLMEIVTHPDIRTAQEASALVSEIRKIVRYIGVSDGDMEKGSLRCDANVSVMLKTATELGTRAEIKNMNSFSFLVQAINYEIERQITEIESGGEIIQETRTWDIDNQRTLSMRDKESADDYRYFPEPDLQPISISEEEIAALKSSLPKLPDTLTREYIDQLGLPINEAMAIVEDKGLSDYFEGIRALTSDQKAAAGWLMGPIKEYLNEHKSEIQDFPISPNVLVSLIALVKNGKVNHGVARDRLFPELLKT